MTKTGSAEGECPECGRTIRRRRPATIAVCDCYLYCPICKEKMQPCTPDLTPSTYGPLDSDTAIGATKRPADILYYCPNCHYYSAKLPVEVELS